MIQQLNSTVKLKERKKRKGGKEKRILREISYSTKMTTRWIKWTTTREPFRNNLRLSSIKD